MAIKVLYFGELRELISLNSENVTLQDPAPTVHRLIQHLSERGSPWSTALNTTDPLRVAINQEMTQLDAAIPDNAEVALFRPVTGG